MADEPKPENPAEQPAPAAADKPAEPTPPAEGDKPADAPQPGAPQAEALSDGTAPTILKQGQTPSPGGKSKGPAGKLGGVYRRADIVTTGITFLIAIVVSLLVVGGYSYVNRPAKSVTPPKLTTLSADQIKQLGGFLTGNSAGEPSEVLTINSSSLFNNRVAINSDLKVTGAASVSGPTSLSSLIVDGTATLGVTNVRGQLTLQGPLTVQSPAVLSDGATVTGNLTVSANGTFGGTLGASSVTSSTLSVSGLVSLGGHITFTSGATPTITSGGVSGTDEAGIITGLSGNATVTFKSAYSKTPIVVLTPTTVCPGSGQFYVQALGGTAFLIGNPADCPDFNYFVVQ